MQEPVYSNHRKAQYNNGMFYNISFKSGSNNFLEHLENYEEKYSYQIKKPWIYFTLKDSREFRTSGWKIHISATYNNKISILKIVTKYCISKNLNFKFLDSNDTFMLFNSKEISRPSAGKFIVIYVADSHIREISKELHQLLKKYKGPYILSDKPYKDSKVVYFRYGEHLPISILNERGTTDSFVLDGKNNLRVDKRVPYYVVPDDIEDISFENKQENESLLLEKYKPIKSLSFSGSGGVYLMQSRKDSIDYVVKEARDYTGLDSLNRYATERLYNEYELLLLLESYSIAPKAIELIDDCNNRYLVQEYLQGLSLRKFILKNNPIMRPEANQNSLDAYISSCVIIINNILNIMEVFEEKSMVLQDLSFNNFIVAEQTLSVKIIDLEYCKKCDGNNILDVYTPGFRTSGRGYKEKQAEYVKLSKLFLSMLFPNNIIYDNFPEKSLAFCLRYNQIYCNDMADRIMQMALISFEKECTINDLRERLESIPSNHIMQYKPWEISEEIILEFHSDILNTYGTPIESRAYFFPADPHLFNTNMFSVAHGLYGILYSLHVINKNNNELKEIVNNSVLMSMPAMMKSGNKIPIGLMMGYSGIVWSLLELGYKELALKLYDEKVMYKIPDNHGYFYGKSGVLLTALKLYEAVKKDKYLNHALMIYDEIDNLELDDFGVNAFGNGNSGIALALLYLYKVTDNDEHLTLGEKILSYEIEQLNYNSGVVGINRTTKNDDRTVHSPYIYDGISGVGTTILRYYKVTNDKKYLMILNDIINSCDYEMTLFSTYMRGMSGIVSFLTDCIVLLSINLDITNKCYQIIEKLIPSIGLHVYNNTSLNVKYFLGEQLYKASMDYAAGSSGIILQLDYYLKAKKNLQPQNPNYLLDYLL